MVERGVKLSEGNAEIQSECETEEVRELGCKCVLLQSENCGKGWAQDPRRLGTLAS